MGRCKPFLRWPGGKRWLASTLSEIVKGLGFGSYYEPFLGGAAIFFAVEPQRAVLSDMNRDLVNTYRQVKADPDRLIALLKLLPVDPVSYLAIRKDCGLSGAEAAARFLYLNRTAFAGIYRVNRKGEFNVPFGGGQRRPEVLWRDGLLHDACEALQHADLRCGDFEEVLTGARAGDLVYCDPTYTVSHNNNGFIRYNESNFSWSDQQRLAKTCRRLQEQGTMVIVSNAHHEDVRQLYPSAETLEVERKSLLCPTATKRGGTKEYLFLLRP